ncbi:hypothetical protein [Pseudalkalibacillus decolorationis]|uniref:hypothetical protein n=1 Tax=Pseudalkalibacillus decolorationis TaxID=163879 RepID=UPI002148D6AD|nr:hypothetical protein [Pseudalkalibacillus decolorationis]
MAKGQSPSFVLTLELERNPLLFSILEKELEGCRVIYNTVLGIYLKREHQYKREKVYKRCIRQLKGIHQKLRLDEDNPTLKEEKKNLYLQLNQLREKYQLTEYAAHQWIKPIRQHFGNQVNAAVAQKIASRVWLAFRQKLFGKATKVRFIRKGEMVSLEGKTNTTGWRYVDRHLVYKDLSTSLRIQPNDGYASTILSQLENQTSFSYTKTKEGKPTVFVEPYRVKYVRVVKKGIRGNVRYFADLVIGGYPPIKTKTLGKGPVGLDIGTSTLAVSSLAKVGLWNLADQVQRLSRDIRLLQRKMDRSKRAVNPENYHEDCTIKKGKKTWIYSKRYQLLRTRLQECYRKQRVVRKQSHNHLSNLLLSFGDCFYIETMNFKALQKRKKDTEVSEKTGKMKRKKRFGKSIGHRAPAMLVQLIEQKVKRLEGTFVHVQTQSFKASQYCHQRRSYMKKPLAQRWHPFEDGSRVQRDLYSAFLLMNANQTGTRPVQKRCQETYPLFKRNHDETVNHILTENKMILNSGIVLHP